MTPKYYLTRIRQQQFVCYRTLQDALAELLGNISGFEKSARISIQQYLTS